MKFRSLVILAAGVAIGMALARKVRQDEPHVVKGPVEGRIPANPAVRAVSTQAQRLADKATVASLDAIRRAREAIQGRLTESRDDAAWN